MSERSSLLTQGAQLVAYVGELTSGPLCVKEVLQKMKPSTKEIRRNMSIKESKAKFII